MQKKLRMFGTSTGIFSNHRASIFGWYSSLILLVCLGLLCLTAPAVAEVTWSGDLDPADPTTWTSSTDGYVGNTGEGMVQIENGSGIESMYGYIGRESSSIGEVTVDGSDSTWTNVADLHIGYGSVTGIGWKSGGC